MNSHPTHSNQLGSLVKPITTMLLVGVIFVGMLIALSLGQSIGTASLAQSIRSLFGTNSVQLWWFITRASGLTGYFLLWLSMVWGFAFSTKIIQPVLETTFTYEFHEYLSLLGLGFVVIHVAVLLFDKFLPFSLVQLLVPFVNSYRPFWVGLGIISFYILLLVTFTFYLRGQIGTRAFRTIHVLSLVSYLGTTLHGLFAGTDSALPVAMVLYAGTFLVVLFLTIYWLTVRLFGKEDEHAAVTHVAIPKQVRRR